MRTTIEK
jgi:hypothetical protein